MTREEAQKALADLRAKATEIRAQLKDQDEEPWAKEMISNLDKVGADNTPQPQKGISSSELNTGPGTFRQAANQEAAARPTNTTPEGVKEGDSKKSEEEILEDRKRNPVTEREKQEAAAAQRNETVAARQAHPDRGVTDRERQRLRDQQERERLATRR